MFDFLKSKKKSGNQKQMDEVAVGIARLLESQLVLCRSSEKLEDDWAVGYVGGFTNAVLQYKAIEADEKGMLIMASAFEILFGPGNGITYLKRYAQLQSTGSRAALEGEETAGHEAFAVLGGTRKMALGLVAYCQDMKDAEWLGPNGN